MRIAKKKQTQTALVEPAISEPLDPKTARRATLLCLAALAALVLALFRTTLWQSTYILGARETDMAGQFLAWRGFGFKALAGGDFPLWNPYIYAGEPYFGGMQSALLYPPNIIFLLLPLNAALNWSIATNMWLLGAFMFAWARTRGLSHPASFLAGAIAMLCGAYTPHIYAGHLSNLCTMPWAPLILLSIDGWIDRRHPKWLLIAIGAIAIQILAGHMQYVFFTAIVAGMYSLARLTQISGRIRAAAGLLAIYPAGAMIAGIQILTAMEASGESIRSAKTTWDFVSSFSFPPQNLLTMIAPYAYGSPAHYFGEGFQWEFSIFIGVAGLALVIVASIRANLRRDWPLYAMIVATMILALGKYTPALKILFEYVPGFDLFRGYSKFIFQASLFFALLAGIGFDSLRARRSPLELAGVLLLPAVILFAVAWEISRLDPTDWLPVLFTRLNMKVASAVIEQLRNPEFQAGSHRAVIASLAAAGASCLFVAAILVATRRTHHASWALLGFAVAELFVFSNTVYTTFSIKNLPISTLAPILDPPGEDRILIGTGSNTSMLVGRESPWGDDPYVTRRYAEYVTWANGGDPKTATQFLEGIKPSEKTALLRLSKGYAYENKKWTKIEAPFAIPPHLILTPRWRVMKGRDEIFEAIHESPYAILRETLLEQDPGLGEPASSAQSPGSARLIEKTPDSLTIETSVTAPAILVVSDAYSKGWRARALSPGPQSEYKIIPANYWMRGIPLKPGRHKIILEFIPRSFVTGAWLSAISLTLYLAAWWLIRRRRLPG